ncbi:hypothetical protein GJ496_010840 [Pomphorhynchus laevis]|nr:hypothetical protein GJ496_010840 [Pomphorhynchus laevis]
MSLNIVFSAITITSLDTSRYNPFPFPQAAFNLLKRIPPVTSFQGPFVYLDQFMEICQNMKLPDKFHSSLAETFMNYKEPKPELSEIPFSPIKDETDESEDETIDD